jgi:hypothetical protein
MKEVINSLTVVSLLSFAPLCLSYALDVLVHLIHTTSQAFALLPSNKLNIYVVYIQKVSVSTLFGGTNTETR